MWRRLSRRLLAAGLLLLAISTSGEGVLADQGVAVDLGRIAIDQELSKGGTYNLPVMGVTNPGDERTHYRMGVSYFTGQAEQMPGAGWFSFSPAEFDLDPGRTQPVSTTLRIPTGAKPADYLALVQSSIAPTTEGATLGAAAGARLTFTVKPSSSLEAWTLRIRERASGWSPWVYLVPAGLVVLGVLWFFGRRYSFRVARRQ